MTEKEYYYNVELLKLLEDMIKHPPKFLGEDYFIVYIHYLRERLDNMFDGENGKETR